MSSKTLQGSHFNSPKFATAIALEKRTHHTSEKLFWMLHLIQIFLLTQTVQATQVSAFYIVWLIALHSEGRAPATHATSYLGKNTRSDVGDSVFYAKNSSKLERLILRIISEFGDFWKVATNARSCLLHCTEDASPAPGNVPDRSPSMHGGELGCNPALNRIQWDPWLQHLRVCQRMHMCCYTLYQSAQSLGQNRRSADTGTAWIFSFCELVTASLLLHLTPGVPGCAALQHGCAHDLLVPAAGG